MIRWGQSIVPMYAGATGLLWLLLMMTGAGSPG